MNENAFRKLKLIAIGLGSRLGFVIFVDVCRLICDKMRFGECWLRHCSYQ